MKGYMKVELVLEIDSNDLDHIWMIEDWVFDEINATTIHKDIKVVEKCIDWLSFEKWIEDWFEDLF